MRNLKLKNVGRGYTCYFCCMPVLLHIHCKFWHCHPNILQHLNVNDLHLFH